MSGSRPSVLLIPDKPGWAIDRKARQLERWLGGRYRIRCRFKREVSAGDLLAADLIVVFYWLEFADMESLAEIFSRRRDRLLIGICGHVDLDGARYQPGLATLRTLARGVFATSRLLVQEFAPLLDVPVFYTPNGVDTSFFRPTDGGRRRHAGSLCVGWAGSLSNAGPEHRGYHDLIVPAVAAAGGARLRTAIREERWRTAEEMPAFYHSLDAYVCASRSEGTPNPCLEAAACGVPVVVARVGVMPELVEDGVNGLFVERRVEDITAKLELLRDAPDLGARLAAHMLVSITAWDWRHRSQAYAAMFDWALGRGLPADVSPLPLGTRVRPVA